VGIKQRIEKLEAGTIGSPDLDHAIDVFRAWCLVRDNPERATDKDRLLAAEDWQEALCTLIDAAGGLEAVVLAAMRMGKRPPVTIQVLTGIPRAPDDPPLYN
jgi:hypothetical protein